MRGFLLAEVVGVEQGIPPWAQEIRERLARIEERLDNFHDVRKAAFGAKELAEDVAEDVRDLQDDRKWVWRAVLGAWIAALADIVLRR